MFRHLEPGADAYHAWNFTEAVKAELAANGWGEKNTNALLNYQLPHLLCLDFMTFEQLQA